MRGYGAGDIEDAVLAALEPVLEGRVQTLRHHQGDWREDLRQETWRLPAVLVRLGERRSVPAGTGAYEVSLDLQVLVITRDLRGEAEGRRGTAGTYALSERVREALWHRDLGLEILPLWLLEERTLVSSPEYGVLALTFRTGWLESFPG